MRSSSNLESELRAPNSPVHQTSHTPRPQAHTDDAPIVIPINALKVSFPGKPPPAVAGPPPRPPPAVSGPPPRPPMSQIAKPLPAAPKANFSDVILYCLKRVPSII